MTEGFREKVFRAVAMIPEGRVGSYAQVAELAGFAGAARAVGNALHINTNPVQVPCHRVVCADGSLADGYAFGGPEKQKERLKAEGVVFKENDRKVDMVRCGIAIEDHPLEPFLPSDGRVLFLGSFHPPRARWSMDFFYPNFQNDFWRIQGLVHFADAGHFMAEGRKCFDCAMIKTFCRENGLAFFDTASRVCRLKGNASDDFLVILRPADIASMLQTMPMCRTIVSTGGKSSEELVGILDRLGITSVVQPPVGMFTDVRVNNEDIRWWRMPSSSRAYPMKLEAKAALYRKVF